MVLSVKDIGTPGDNFKARLAAHGQKDKYKVDRVQNYPTIRPISLRILLTAAAIKRFRILATYIIQAFIQAFDLMRQVFMILPKEFNVPPDDIFQLINPL